MDFIYVLIGTGSGAGTPPPGYSGNAPILNGTASYSQLPISANTIILLVVLAILIVGFILYRRHLKGKYG